MNLTKTDIDKKLVLEIGTILQDWEECNITVGQLVKLVNEGEE